MPASEIGSSIDSCASRGIDLHRRYGYRIGRIRRGSGFAVVVIAPANGAPTAHERTVVVGTRGDGRRSRHSRHSLRRVRVRERARRDLLVAVIAPAHHRAITHDRTGMVAARGDTERGNRGKAANGCGRRDRAGARGIANLQLIVASPALNRSTREQRAGVIRPRRDRHDAASKRHGRRKIVAEVLRGASSQLPLVVPSPAFDRPIQLHCAGMEGAGGDLGGPEICNGTLVAIHRDRAGRVGTATDPSPASKCRTGVRRRGQADRGAIVCGLRAGPATGTAGDSRRSGGNPACADAPQLHGQRTCASSEQ